MNQNSENDEIEIDLKDLMFHIFRKWWLLLLCTVLCFLLSFIGTKFLITPKYESQAMLYILNKTTSVTSMADIQVGNALSTDFAIIAKSKPVLDGALDKLTQYHLDRKKLLDMLTVTNETDTRILTISAKDDDPTVASDVANAVAEETADQMAFIMQTDPPTTIEKAEVEKNPVSPSLLKNTLIGAVVGFLLAAGFCVITFIMNDKVRSSDDIEKVLGINTLVVVPKESDLENDKYYKKKREEGRREKVPAKRKDAGGK